MPRLSSSGRGWNFVIFPMKEYVRIVKWIAALQLGSPGLAHVAPLAIGPLPLSRIVTVESSRRTFQVKQLRKRGPDNPIPVMPKPQAEINVVEDDRQIKL